MSNTEAIKKILTGSAIPTSLKACLLIETRICQVEEVTYLVHTTEQIGAKKLWIRKLTTPQKKKHSGKANYKEAILRSWITANFITEPGWIVCLFVPVVSSVRLYTPRGLKLYKRCLIHLFAYTSHLWVHSRVYNYISIQLVSIWNYLRLHIRGGDGG